MGGDNIRIKTLKCFFFLFFFFFFFFFFWRVGWAVRDCGGGGGGVGVG